jgi:hypothetical protein
MAKVDIEEARSEVGRELDLLARTLQNTDICPDAWPVFNAARQCRNGAGLPNNQWGYRLDQLIFRPGVTERAVPAGVHTVSVELTVEVVSSHWDRHESADPFDTLEFNLVLQGEYQKEARPVRTFLSWHLDRHIEGDDGEEAEDEGIRSGPSFVHPLYHFQLGGQRLWGSIGQGLEYGNALFLEAPRIAHPPMDAVLGIDFVLTNFFPQARLGVRSDRTYQNVVAAAQRRCWRPYVHALIAAWEPMPQFCRLRCCDLWPQLPAPGY